MFLPTSSPESRRTPYALASRDDVHANAPALEANDAVNQREKGVVSPSPHVATGLERRTALAQDDGSDGDRLARVPFDAAELRIAIPTVSC